VVVIVHSESKQWSAINLKGRGKLVTMSCGKMSSLSKAQRVVIVDRLRKNKPHAVLLTFAGGDIDVSDFACDLAQVLRKGGWNVSGPSPAAYVPMAGVLVGVDDFSSPHPSALLLVDVLTAAGIGAKMVQAAVSGSDRCCLIVGCLASSHEPQEAA